MQDMPLTSLLVLLVFVLVPLINLLLRPMRRRFATQSPREPARQPALRTIGKPPLEIVPSAESRVSGSASTEMPRSSQPPLPTTVLFRSRRDLRRAILLMAVLGPCRADDASDADRRQFPLRGP